MTRTMELGELISALYDTVDHFPPPRGRGPLRDRIVAACTVDLLLRCKQPLVLAELVSPGSGSRLRPS